MIGKQTLSPAFGAANSLCFLCCCGFALCLVLSWCCVHELRADILSCFCVFWPSIAATGSVVLRCCGRAWLCGWVPKNLFGCICIFIFLCSLIVQGSVWCLLPFWWILFHLGLLWCFDAVGLVRS